MIFIIILGCFAAVLLFGAPYLPTLKSQQKTALALLDLKPGQLLLDPGCGDGRVLLAAARDGIYGVGYELNPILFVVAKLTTWRYRQKVKIYWGDFWRAEWPPADGIYVFLIKKYMAKLNKKIIQCRNERIKVVSYASSIPGREVVRQQNGLFLYEYGH